MRSFYCKAYKRGRVVASSFTHKDPFPVGNATDELHLSVTMESASDIDSVIALLEMIKSDFPHDRRSKKV